MCYDESGNQLNYYSFCTESLLERPDPFRMIAHRWSGSHRDRTGKQLVFFMKQDSTLGASLVIRGKVYSIRLTGYAAKRKELTGVMEHDGSPISIRNEMGMLPWAIFVRQPGLLGTSEDVWFEFSH